MSHWHRLVPCVVPFSAPIHYEMGASAERRQNILALTFAMVDPLHEVVWPQKRKITRKDYLWEKTCLEAFISTPNQTEYFELNLSPTRAWNLYHFTNYRTPDQIPPVAVEQSALVKFDVQKHTIDVEIDLNLLNLADQDIILGLNAVIKTTNGLTYFALVHPKPEADFHDARGWTITLLRDE
jgi:hypothetical protein